MPHTYLIAIGSNMRARGKSPPKIVAAAVAAIARQGWSVEAISPIIASEPVGPSQRRYANAAAVITGGLSPCAALSDLQAVEGAFGRVRRGQRWRARPLDLDIVLWSGGIFSAPDLAIPHPLFRHRSFVLRPAAAIAPDWRDPVSGLTVRQLAARLRRPRPV